MKGLKKLFVCYCAVTLSSGVAVGEASELVPAEFALVPKSASGSYSIVGNEITLDGGGQRVFIELELSGWTPNNLHDWQAVIDGRVGYSSGFKGTLTPFTGLIDQFRADYVFTGYTSFPAVDVSTVNYRYASTVFMSAGPPDPGVAKYGGALEVDVPVGAVGTFTIGFVLEPTVASATLLPQTYMNDPFGVPILPLTLTPVAIRVLCQVDDECDDSNACTNDSCVDGECSYVDNYDPETHCCDPVTGDLTLIDDDNVCTIDICWPDGSVTHPPDDGASCDDDVYCNGADTCSGGSCVVHAGDPCPGPDGDANCAESCDEVADDCAGDDPNGSACDDGAYCNGTETCTNGTCGGSTGDPCPGPDGDADCSEVCNEVADDCSANDPVGSSCDLDGWYCTEDTCDGGGTCDAGGDPCPGPDGDSDCSESCDEVADNCEADDPNGSTCSDGLYCTGTETCTSGVCGSSTGDPCPGPDGDDDCTESCSEGADNCTANDPNGSACDDGAYCSGTETCTSGICTNSTGDPCPGPDGDADCAESCDETADNCLANDPGGSGCDLDGLYCTDDTCDGGGTCDPGGDPCPGPDGDSNCAESCNETADDCTANDPDASPCDDGLYCSGTETCTSGVCGSSTGDPCPGPDGDADCRESCNESANDCTANDPNGSACDDSAYCSGTETCTSGVCGSSTGDPCPGPDGDADCAESCNEIGDDCTANDPVGSGCDLDGLYCTTDTCDGSGTCDAGGDPCPGPDGDNDCSESCNETADDCTENDPNGSACSDGLYCTGTETCTVGICTNSTGNPCPGPDGDGDCKESCNELADDCTANDPNGSTCDDSLYCNVDEVCLTGACANGADRDCGDGVDCTDDWCDEIGDICMNDVNDANCNNGQWCDGVEICDDVLDCITQAGSVPDCDDSIACTDDWCNEIDDVCENDPNDENCDNGQWCDGVEICDEALDCITQPGSVPDPDDGVGCTDDSCDEVDDVIVNTPNDAHCPDDGLYCNGDEYCHQANDCDHTGSPCSGPCDEDEDKCLCEAPIVEGVGCRYLRIALQPPDSGAQAILVKPDCPTGVAKYVGVPASADMDRDGVDDENVAALVDDPADAVFLTPAEWGELYVYDTDDIAPGNTHIVWGDCGSPGSPGLSDPSTGTTPIWGDTVGFFEDGEWLPPDGDILILDAIGVVESFQHLPTAPDVYRVDLKGVGLEGLTCEPDQVGDIIPDAIAVLDAFQGKSFEDSGCDDPCVQTRELDRVRAGVKALRSPR